MNTISNFYYKLFPNKYKNGVTEYLLENNHKQNLVGVEIGVGRGRNAFSMLTQLPIKRLYLVDPYEPFLEGGELVSDYCGYYADAVKRLHGFDNRIVFVKEFADVAVNHIFEDLDFVWFDASGEYSVVKGFLSDWYPKLCVGGVLSGKRFNSNWFGLCRAVLEFVSVNRFDCFGCNSGDWWIVKE